MLCGCGVPEPVILTLDLAKAEADLAGGGRSCRSCGQSLAPWGYARPRSVAGADGTRVQVRPRRARCRGCGATHVLLPAQVLPRCSAGSDLVGKVLLAAAQGAGHRTIAERCSLPEGTVRRWLRRARDNAEWLRQLGTGRAFELDANLPPLRDQPTPLACAVDALATAAAAAVRLVGPIASPWAAICVMTGGQLLAARPNLN